MNRKITLAIAVFAGILLLTKAVSTGAQAPSASPRFEFAVIKFDGPDQIQYILPDRFEFVRMLKTGTKLPKDAHDEEYFLTQAANELGKDGWDVVNLNATRILLRRPATTRQ